MRSLAVQRLTIYPLAIRLRSAVVDARSIRALSEPVVLAVELMNGTVGFGETLPEQALTGETPNSVIDLLRDEYVRELLAFSPGDFFEALEAIDSLPMLTEAGQLCTAARTCVELALLDACLRSESRRVSDVVGWLGLPGYGSPGSAHRSRCGVVLATRSLAELRRLIRRGRLRGCRDFKLHVGMPDDDDRIATVRSALGRALARGRATLSIDAGGAWDLPEAVQRLRKWTDLPLMAVEQPLAKHADASLVALRDATDVRVRPDESVVTLEDAERLHELGVADGFNIRIAKCGGLLPSLRLARFAQARGIDVRIGSALGQTSVLSAAGVRMLEHVPGLRSHEAFDASGCLASDIVRRSVRPRLGGRTPRILDEGLGVELDEALLSSLCADQPLRVEL